MKRIVLLFVLSSVMISAVAMGYEEARERAWFLTDKMAYELNLTPEQYDMAYQVNLDYLLSLRTASDSYGVYWDYRNVDLRNILFDWQYVLYKTIDYFYRPIRWARAAWYFPIFDRYRSGYYYFARPNIYITFRGHGWTRRGHNDVSPYMGMKFTRGSGMRDLYHKNPGGAPIQSRPAPGGQNNRRPDRDRPSGFGGQTTRPGTSSERERVNFNGGRQTSPRPPGNNVERRGNSGSNGSRMRRADGGKRKSTENAQKAGRSFQEGRGSRTR